MEQAFAKKCSDPGVPYDFTLVSTVFQDHNANTAQAKPRDKPSAVQAQARHSEKTFYE